MYIYVWLCPAEAYSTLETEPIAVLWATRTLSICVYMCFQNNAPAGQYNIDCSTETHVTRNAYTTPLSNYSKVGLLRRTYGQGGQSVGVGVVGFDKMDSERQ